MLIRFFLVFCLGLLQSCNEPSSNTIKFGLASMPSNLDPRYATDATSIRIERLLYQRLVEFDESKKVIPSIANWQRLSPTHFQFILNESANNFIDKTLLDAYDVKATYDFVLDKRNASPHRAALQIIERIETTNNKTIDFYLNKPDPLFPSYLAVSILPDEKILKGYDFNKQPIGSGDFKLVAKKEDKVHLQRRRDKMLIDFIHVPDPTVRVLKILRGEVDIVQNDLMPELVKYLKTQEKIYVHKRKGSNFSYVGFNMQDPILSQIKIRQAIALSINREEIINTIFGGAARKALSILPPDHWAGNDSLPSFSYNPEKAKQLLSEFGYTQRNPLKLTFKTSSDPFRLRLATIYQHQFKKVGIELSIRSYDWGTFYGDIKNGRFQLYSLAWVGINTPDIFKYTSHSKSIPPGGANRGRYINPQVDELIDQAETQQNLADQLKYYVELQRLLLKDLPYVPLWYEDNVLITRKHIKNYRLAADGNYDGLKLVSL